MSGSLRVVVAKLVLFAAATLAMTGLLAAVIGNIQPFTRTYTVHAEFTDATGLLVADVVKIAGVNVGKVTGAEVSADGLARVALQIRRDVKLPRTVKAAIRYRNLLGQRMVVLSRDPDSSDRPALRPGATIPASRTVPALDLGIVFNNLRPVLRSLDPQDVNIVSRAIVKVFAGREVLVQRMVEQVADLAETLGDRGPVASRLVADLNVVVSSLAARDIELQSILTSFDQVLAALQSHSAQLARAVQDVGDTANGIAGVLEANRPALDRAVADLQSILALVAKHKADLDATLKALPSTSAALNRATTYGEWVNLSVVCLDGLCAPGFGQDARAGGLADVYRLPLESP